MRRGAALALFALAVTLALAPTGPGPGHARTVLVAARDLPAGATLRPADVRAVSVSGSAVSAGALSSANQVSGRALDGPVRAGEQLTDVRLAGPAAPGPGQLAVPVRLADPAVGDLVRPGSRVDVVAADDAPDSAGLLANDARVVSVHAADDDGKLLVLAVPSDVARRIASITGQRKVTVILR